MIEKNTFNNFMWSLSQMKFKIEEMILWTERIHESFEGVLELF